jgi:hypothetical protein
MKRFIAVFLLTSFMWASFASYASDVGDGAKTELVKKSIDLVAVEQAGVIDVDAQAVQPISYIDAAEVNVSAQSRPLRATANAPPLK